MAQPWRFGIRGQSEASLAKEVGVINGRPQKQAEECIINFVGNVELIKFFELGAENGTSALFLAL